MAKPTRHRNPDSSISKKNTADRKTGQMPINLDQTDGIGTNLRVDQTGVGFVTQDTINLAPSDIIIMNTDDKLPSQPGNSMIPARHGCVQSFLEDRSELVSIVVQAYNRLDKTKYCIECILKYTSGIDYELILVDNGSTDGTLDYFKSIDVPQKKIIRVTKNIGSYVPNLLNHLSGRYFVFLPNDVYVTQNWLSNLLNCLTSDPAIGLAISSYSNAGNSHKWGVPVTFSNFEEYQEKAARHNVSDPRLWHERFFAIYLAIVVKKEVVDITGWLDYGFFHDHTDFDIYYRIRRAGYKVMLCKDTLVHHDHDQFRQNNPEELERYRNAGNADRAEFNNKYYGLDSWNDGSNYETGMIALVNPQEHKECKEMEILGIDVRCGTPILELKNKLREAQVFDARLSAFSTDPKYWLDLKTICTGAVIVDRIEFLNEHFTDERFDYIVLGKTINSYQNPFKLLQQLLKRLKSNGHLLLKLHNTFDILSLFKTLGANIQIEHSDDVYQLSIDELIDQIKNTGFIYKKITVENWPLEENNLQFLRNAIKTTGFNPNPDEVFARAVVQDFVIDIARE
ncbi:MAG: glycosyltransferase family 2 protein [Chloroflexi bacterium]|nr:glycosyltransferase family 2 protein [Chloroflexota bacterium]